MTLLLVVGFAAVMLVAVRPALRRWMRRPSSVLANQLLAREAATAAALVNTRGLTELNVGPGAGLSSDRLFSVLVLMAILLTVVTAPPLRLSGRGRSPRKSLV